MQDEANQTNQPSKEVLKSAKPSKKISRKCLVLIVVSLVILASSNIAIYILQKNHFEKKINELNNTLQDSKKKNKQQRSSINEMKKTLEAKQGEAPAAPVSNKPDSTTLGNIQDSVKSKNYAALDGYMASNVNVILAASSGIGVRTPAQAIADLNYINAATSPWNFSLSSDLLANWESGPYAQYLSNDRLIGKSANNYVIAFKFDSDKKISDIFIANNSDLLN